MIKYFAYGSNMSVSRMIKRGVTPLSRSQGILNNYILKFNKKSSKGDWSFANIEESEGDVVEGIIFEISELHLEKLDKFEGAPVHYRREKINVISGGNKIECITYIAQNDYIVEGLKPTDDYMKFLIDGSSLLSSDYQKMLISIIDESKTL
jgi:gamma-glutamylcyclotransferase